MNSSMTARDSPEKDPRFEAAIARLRNLTASAVGVGRRVRCHRK